MPLSIGFVDPVHLLEVEEEVTRGQIEDRPVAQVLGSSIVGIEDVAPGNALKGSVKLGEHDAQIAAWQIIG